MKILDLDELPESCRPQLAALKWLDGDAPQDARFIARIRRLGYPSSPYFAVYAVEDGEILARVETLHLPFRSELGTQTTVGIADVMTRPDALHRGFARALLEAVHRRETAAGRSWAFLWTRRSWGAHRLYEQLGYRDVYTSPSALKSIGRGRLLPLDPGYRWRRATRRDLGSFERILAASTRERWGFLPRYHGSFRLKDAVGWRPAASHRVLLYRDRPVGYAYVSSDPQSLGAYEIVAAHPSHGPMLLRALEREARGRWLAIGMTSFAADHDARLRATGYATYRSSHGTLMARPLGPRGTDRDPDLAARTCADPRFSLHRGDMF